MTALYLYRPEVWFTFESIYMRHSVSTYFICNYMMFLGYWWTMHKPYVAVVVKIYLYRIKLCSKSYICSCTHCTTNMMMHFFKKKRIESQIISQCNKNEKNSVINNVGMRGCKIKLVVVSFLNSKKPLDFSLWYQFGAVSLKNCNFFGFHPWTPPKQWNYSFIEQADEQNHMLLQKVTYLVVQTYMLKHVCLFSTKFFLLPSH